MDRRVEAQEYVDKAKRVDVSMVGLHQVQCALSRRSCSLLREYRGWFLVVLARLMSLYTGSLINLLPAESGLQVPSVEGKYIAF